MVSAVSVAVTPPAQRDADGIGTSELAFVTGGKVAVLFVRVVAAVVPVVALLGLVDAPAVLCTPELIQLTGGGVAFAVLLVTLIATVYITVALFGRRDTDTAAAHVVSGQAGAVRAWLRSLVCAVDAVNDFVTLPVPGDAVGLIEDVLTTGKLIRTAVRRWTGLPFVLSAVTVALVVTDPASWDAATIIALEVVRRAGGVDTAAADAASR